MFHAARKGIKDTTRRILKLRDGSLPSIDDGTIATWEDGSFDKVMDFTGCFPHWRPPVPPHLPGEIKPMVTTWATHQDLDARRPTELPNPNPIPIWFNDGADKPSWAGKSRPGRFLPKTLYSIAPQVEILTVTPEFLQDITEESALREGISQITKDVATRASEDTVWKFGLADRDGLPGSDDFGWPWNQWCLSARLAYFKLWDSIDDGQYAAAKNPVVWVITFRLLPTTANHA